ncbi:MAG TPA: low specificity L-threonine aldolase, partial [Firmicutes bacterium]|nr:low specificity L-threonine aldolase [Bacillota bacterium]
MGSVIDLRSDTVTVPTPAMRKAMYEAEVGDDVYGEDPTICRLEEMAARRLGKEAGLFVTSGTMGNLVSILTHTRPGNEIILEAESHIFYYEVGGCAALGGVMVRTVPGERGAIDPKRLEDVIRGQDIHFPPTALIALENTHNRAGGAVIPLEKIKA